MSKKVTDEEIKQAAMEYFDSVAKSANEYKLGFMDIYIATTKTASNLFDYYETEVSREEKNDK